MTEVKFLEGGTVDYRVTSKDRYLRRMTKRYKKEPKINMMVVKFTIPGRGKWGGGG